MRVIRQFFLSIVAVIWVTIDALILVLSILNVRATEKHVSGDDKIYLISIGFYTIMGVILLFKSFPDELKNYKEERDSNMKKSMILRSDIANMLKQYQCDDLSTKITKSDLEFVKELLLPVKASLIKGLQCYKVKKNINLDDYSYGYADKCIQAIRDGDFRWALKWLTSIFDSTSFFISYCSYCELITGVLLVSNILGLCDKKLTEIVETEQSERAPHGKHFIEKCMSGEQCLDNLESELFRAGYDFYRTASLKEYFNFNDEEYSFIKRSMLESFRVIIECRKKNVSMKSYEKEIQDKISCFFSALGAPCRPAEPNLHTERRGNLK